MRESQVYRHFVKMADDEWQVLWGGYAAFVHEMHGRWTVYLLGGSRLLDRDFSTPQQAIDAYWNIKAL